MISVSHSLAWQRRRSILILCVSAPLAAAAELSAPVSAVIGSGLAIAFSGILGYKNFRAAVWMRAAILLLPAAPSHAVRMISIRLALWGLLGDVGGWFLILSVLHRCKMLSILP